MFNALELLMIVLSLGVIVVGLSRRWYLPGVRPETQPGADWRGLLAAVLLQRRILTRPIVGAAHLCLVWGFMIYILIVIVAQTPLILPSTGASVVSLVLDTVGLLMLVSAIFFLVRRIKRNNAKLDSRAPKRVLLPLGLLLVILVSGFFAEGVRLNITHGQPFMAAPVGWIMGSFLPSAPAFMQAMLRVHFTFVILFFISLPYTFMHHLGSTTVNLLYQGSLPAQLPSTVALETGPLGAGAVTDLHKNQQREVDACVSCGRCDEQCPALISGKPLSPRTVVGKIVDQMDACRRSAAAVPADSAADVVDRPGVADLPALSDAISDDEIWACTTCMACVSHCPADVRPMDKILELRRHRVLARGALPTEATAAIRNLELFGDVNGKGASHKSDWALNRQVARVNAKMGRPEVLIWVGCSGAFHPEYQETTRSLVKVLRAAKVDFAILGPAELCCGDPARKLGDEALFLDLARKNIRQLQQNDIRRIVTLCPHCFNTLGREYPRFGLQAEVHHAVQLVDQLIQEGRIHPKYPYTKSVAVHDPCYLGRYNGIYEPLRRVCAAVPGVTLKEPGRNRGHGFCCGGGGGRMWLHENLGENINHLRAMEIAATGADTVATACPYCLTMMADGMAGLEDEKKPAVIDIIQLTADAIG